MDGENFPTEGEKKERKFGLFWWGAVTVVRSPRACEKSQEEEGRIQEEEEESAGGATVLA